MTQKDKKLLLVDLCARLPYGVMVLEDTDKEFDGGCVSKLATITEIKEEKVFLTKGSLTPVTIEEIRPYLRPMSSMTEKEKDELKEIGSEYLEKWENAQDSINKWRLDAEVAYKRSEFYNSHLLDWRGLIQKGLAIEAPKDMYNLNK